MADVNGGKKSFETRWVDEANATRTLLCGCQRAARQREAEALEAVGSDALWWLSTNRERARETRDRGPLVFQAQSRA